MKLSLFPLDGSGCFLLLRRLLNFIEKKSLLIFHTVRTLYRNSEFSCIFSLDYSQISRQRHKDVKNTDMQGVNA